MDKQILEDIEHYGKMQFTLPKVAICFGMTDEELQQMMEEHPELIQAYHKGDLTAQIEWRNAVYKLAIAGSSPAQAQWKTIMDEKALSI